MNGSVNVYECMSICVYVYVSMHICMCVYGHICMYVCVNIMLNLEKSEQVYNKNALLPEYEH